MSRCPKQCLKHCHPSAVLQALQVEQCTYVRTYSQRTTYVDYLSHVAYRAQGGQKK